MTKQKQTDEHERRAKKIERQLDNTKMELPMDKESKEIRKILVEGCEDE
jgi:hypothetical protein